MGARYFLSVLASHRCDVADAHPLGCDLIEKLLHLRILGKKSLQNGAFLCAASDCFDTAFWQLCELRADMSAATGTITNTRYPRSLASRKNRNAIVVSPGFPWTT